MNDITLSAESVDFIAVREAAVDQVAVTELRLFADNDGSLYRQRTVPILKNLGKKFRAGKYDAALAVKLWKSWADDVAKRYAAEFATANEWATIFPVSTRYALAIEKEAHEAGEFALGNFVEVSA